MQKVAAYLLERRIDRNDPAELRNVTAKCFEVTQRWLQIDKFVPNPDASAGTYRTKFGATGNYSWETAELPDSVWKHLRLVETEGNGTSYVTAISITQTNARVAVFVTIEAGLIFSAIKPVRVEARCPRVIRYLLELPGDWFHGSSQIFPLQKVYGIEAGEELAETILEKGRSVPIVVVSDNGGKFVFPDLPNRLALDLLAVANVYIIDDPASWGLTYSLGKRYSCYWGAVRVYWPNFTIQDDPFDHPRWTADALASFSQDVNATSTQFTSQLRRIFFQASAFSVLKPTEIDDIKSQSRAVQHEALMAKAKDNVDFEAVVDLLVKDKAILESQLQECKQQIYELNERIQFLRPSASAQDSIQIAPDGPSRDELDDGPQSGDIRFYKCIKHKKIDVMEPVADCRCNSWQGANKADKAKKGIEKLEGRNDWKTIQHCGSCTGGGMWRVKW